MKPFQLVKWFKSLFIFMYFIYFVIYCISFATVSLTSFVNLLRLNRALEEVEKHKQALKKSKESSMVKLHEHLLKKGATLREEPNNNAKSPKNSLKECVALKIQCHVVKNTLLLTVFSVLLPTGNALPLIVV